MTMTAERSKLDWAHILVSAATGEEWGDGYTVTDVIVGYADGSDDDAVIVLGNWNNKRYPREGDAPLTREERLGSRLAKALERFGIECEWLDEWTQCSDCYRAIRTEIYASLPQYAFVEDGYVCAKCLLKDVPTSLEQYVNDAANAVTWCGSAELSAAGFTQWEARNPRTYESGWHSGQTDEPAKVLDMIRRETMADVVFCIDNIGQFDTHWSAWTRDMVEPPLTFNMDLANGPTAYRFCLGAATVLGEDEPDKPSQDDESDDAQQAADEEMSEMVEEWTSKLEDAGYVVFWDAGDVRVYDAREMTDAAREEWIESAASY